MLITRFVLLTLFTCSPFVLAVTTKNAQQAGRILVRLTDQFSSTKLIPDLPYPQAAAVKIPAGQYTFTNVETGQRLQYAVSYFFPTVLGR